MLGRITGYEGVGDLDRKEIYALFHKNLRQRLEDYLSSVKQRNGRKTEISQRQGEIHIRGEAKEVSKPSSLSGILSQSEVDRIIEPMQIQIKSKTERYQEYRQDTTKQHMVDLGDTQEGISQSQVDKILRDYSP
jgi:hypothetical protein